MTEWRVYGCGSASSNLHLQSSYEFKDGKTRIHVDFGNGAFYRRCQAEGDSVSVLNSMRHLILTHSHADHTADLTRHMVAWRYTPGYEPDQATHLYATAETLENVSYMLNSIGMGDVFEEAYHLHEFKIGDSFKINDVKVDVRHAQHIPGSCALKFTSPSKCKVMFTGDTSWFSTLPQQCKNTDLLIAEASFLEMAHFMHLNLNEIAKLAASAKPKSIMLVHMYPDLEALSEKKIQKILSNHYDGKVYVARDGMALKWNQTNQQWQRKKLF